MSYRHCGFCVLILLVDAAITLGQPSEPKALTDIHGDALPAGAIARMGTVRLRHGMGVLDYGLSADSNRLISVGAEGTLVEWSAADGKELRRHTLDGAPFRTAVLSADRSLLVTMADEGNALVSSQITPTTNRTVRLWNVATGKEIRKITDSAKTTGGIALSSDGKKLASISQGYVIHLWETQTGMLLHTLDGMRRIIFPGIVTFSPDGDTLASSDGFDTILLWNTRTGKKLREIEIPQTDKVKTSALTTSALTFSPDGKLLASAGISRDVFVWDPKTGKEVRRFRDVRVINTMAAFLPDSKSVAFRGKDSVAHEWDIRTGAKGRPFPIGNRPVFSADGKTVLMSNGNTATLWDVATGKERFSERGHDGTILAAAITPDGRTAATQGRDGIRLWDIATGKPRGAFGRADHLRIAFSPDGKLIASCGIPDGVRLWDPVSTKEIARIPEYKDSFGLGFRKDGTLVTGGRGTINLIDVAAGKVNVLVQKHPGFFHIGVSPDGKQVLTHQYPKLLHLWDLSSGQKIWEVPAPESFMRTSAFSSDGKWFAIADGSTGIGFNNEEQSVHLYRTLNGKKIHQFGKGLRMFHGLAFSPDGRTVATGGADNRVHLWELHTAQERGQLTAHTNMVNALLYTSDGKLLISGSADGTALVWDMRRGSGKPARALSPDDLDRLWADLANADAAKAYQAILTLAETPRQALPFLAKHVPPTSPVPVDRLKALIADLGSERFETRDKATKQLDVLGDLAEPALRRAGANKPTVELRRRIDLLLDKLPAPISSEMLRQLRALEVFERIGTADARQHLAVLAKGAEGSRLTQEAQAALDRLAPPKTP